MFMKFLLKTRSGTDSTETVSINPNHIVAVTDSDCGGSVLHMIGGQTFAISLNRESLMESMDFYQYRS